MVERGEGPKARDGLHLGRLVQMKRACYVWGRQNFKAMGVMPKHSFVAQQALWKAICDGHAVTIARIVRQVDN